MRGAPFRISNSCSALGIIPAYAGSTGFLLRVFVRLWDHPRVCGEHRARGRLPQSSAGSSPRMRGARLMASASRRGLRIIPAYAGSTGVEGVLLALRWDHPRVCGEHIGMAVTRMAEEGSSPRMRGAPAARSSPRCSRRDHPRVCGEHIRFTPWRKRTSGSSPRMRGAPISCCARRSKAGIIPAYAGSTHDLSSHYRSFQDHPRVCGEHEQRRLVAGPHVGSSPRMRGAQRAQCGAEVVDGIIPAYAGSTQRGRAVRIGGRDHPRVCGEHRGSVVLGATEGGSSPRMRGALAELRIDAPT